MTRVLVWRATWVVLTVVTLAMLLYTVGAPVDQGG